ncbi:adaptor protein [Cellulophaga phage Ingeline_1]|uniref:Adaptor protein n=1 Tax=Cellulophaga phage Ingeline_1 TaxID=2745674 RepID=A0A8E4ZBT7_9CAUD|nr:adaptor protein [Cellulophaga phage Ingeline_1]QQV90037.1 adaptor protein [Cellulophaga phage Ingeline_2]QQV90087.1 adaptor protein [Cellulophaga phage Ingeline_3]QQV90137.1 adaptor protein [Cellulophaga phage Ingeline_4]QQV90186.1 adaptor protein [Cellulophaga phage Ingeline_5]QQV90236.1 adaptor protein [Cellulophaga phage Ingeline_6]QQV90286.1 adaptor protein [Cellulophaga phage Ingeline_7]QQV90296.1 adaptor protein [Cellulophaga phage Ingeline_8]
MELIFNKNSTGQVEIKTLLGFTDGDFKYDNLESYIELQTPYLIDIIGQSVYDKVVTYYKEATVVDEKTKSILKKMQFYIVSMAYLDYAPNNDLTHGNSGRTFRSEDNEKIPWDWQIQASNKVTYKNAYTALDQLLVSLDASEWQEWIDSDAYKHANAIFIKNTLEFDKVYPINKSGQLYYKLVPFMDDFENEYVNAILTSDYAAQLKSKTNPSDNEKLLLLYIKKAIAYLSLAKGMKAFPVELLPDSLTFQENTRMKSAARAEVMEFLNAEGGKYLQKLEYEYSQQTATFTPIKTTNGLDEGTKYVNL